MKLFKNWKMKKTNQKKINKIFKTQILKTYKNLMLLKTN